eukprot:scaffold1671_cov344-Pavlova_lutheri.AAC.15
MWSKQGPSSDPWEQRKASDNPKPLPEDGGLARPSFRPSFPPFQTLLGTRHFSLSNRDSCLAVGEEQRQVRARSALAAMADQDAKRLHWLPFGKVLERLQGGDAASALHGTRATLASALQHFQGPNQPSEELVRTKNHVDVGRANPMHIENEWREVALNAGKELHLDALQAYVLVRRTAQGDSEKRMQEGERMLQITKGYFKERQSLLQCLVAVLRMREAWRSGCEEEQMGVEGKKETTEHVEWMLGQGMADKLQTQILATLEGITAATMVHPPTSSTVGMSAAHTGALHVPEEALKQGRGEAYTMWLDEMSIELSLLLEALFLVHYQPDQTERVKDTDLQYLSNAFLQHLFVEVHMTSNMQREQMDWAQNLGILVLIEAMQVEEVLEALSKQTDPSMANRAFRQGSDIATLDKAFGEYQKMLSKGRSGTHSTLSRALPLMVWGAMRVLGGDEHGRELGLAFGMAGYEHGALQRLAQLLNCDVLQSADMQVSGYKSVCKNALSCMLAAFDCKASALPLPQFGAIVESLCRVFDGEEEICEQFWSCVFGMEAEDDAVGIDFPIVQFVDEVKLMLTCSPGPIARILASLSTGQYSAIRAVEYVSDLPHPITLLSGSDENVGKMEEKTVVAKNSIMLENSSGVQIPRGAIGEVLAEPAPDGRGLLIQWNVVLPEKSGLIMLLCWLQNSTTETEVLVDVLSFPARVAKHGGWDVCSMLLDLKLPDYGAGTKGGSLSLLQAATDLASTRGGLGRAALRLIGHVLSLGAALSIYDPQSVLAAADTIRLLAITNSQSTNLQHLLEQGLTGGMHAMQQVLQEERLLGRYDATLGLLGLTSALLERGLRSSSLTIWLGHLLGSLLFSGMQGSWKYVMRKQRWELVAGCFRCIRNALLHCREGDPLEKALQQCLLSDPSTSAAVLSSITLDAEGLERLQEYSMRRVEGMALEAAVKELLRTVPVCMVTSKSISSQHTSAWERVMYSPREDAYSSPVTLLCTYITYRFDPRIPFLALECFFSIVAFSSKARQQQPLLASMLVSNSRGRIKSFFRDALSTKSALHSPELFSSAARALLACIEGENSLAEFFLFPSCLQSESGQVSEAAPGVDGTGGRTSLQAKGDEGCLDSLHSCLEKTRELRSSQPQSLAWLLRLVCAMANDPIQMGYPNHLLSSQSSFWEHLSQCLPGADGTDQGYSELENEIFRYEAEASVLKTLAGFMLQTKTRDDGASSVSYISKLVTTWWQEDRIRSWLSVYAHTEYSASSNIAANEAVNSLAVEILESLHLGSVHTKSVHSVVVESLLDAEALMRRGRASLVDSLLHSSGCIARDPAAALRDYGKSFLYNGNALSVALGGGMSRSSSLADAISLLDGASLEASLADAKLRALRGLRLLLASFSPPLMQMHESFLVKSAPSAVTMACAAVSLYECVCAVQQRQLMSSSLDAGILIAHAKELAMLSVMLVQAWLVGDPSRDQRDALAEAAVLAARQVADFRLGNTSGPMIESTGIAHVEDETMQSLLATALLTIRNADQAAAKAAQDMLPCCCAVLARSGTTQEFSEMTVQAAAAMAACSTRLRGASECTSTVDSIVNVPTLLAHSGTGRSAVACFALSLIASDAGAQLLVRQGLWDVLDLRAGREAEFGSRTDVEIPAGTSGAKTLEEMHGAWWDTLSLVAALSRHASFESEAVTWMCAHGMHVYDSVFRAVSNLSKPVSIGVLEESTLGLALFCAISRARGAWQLAARENFQACREAAKKVLLAVASLSLADSSVGDAPPGLRFCSPASANEQSTGSVGNRRTDPDDSHTTSWMRGVYCAAKNDVDDGKLALKMARYCLSMARSSLQFIATTAAPAPERGGEFALWGKASNAVDALREDCDAMLQSTGNVPSEEDVRLLSALAGILHDIRRASNNPQAPRT